MCKSSSRKTPATPLLLGPLTASTCALSPTLLLVDMKSSIFQLKRLLRRHGPIKAVPMPESVIRKVEELAKRQKMPRGLKIQSKFTKVTYPAEVDDDDDDQRRRQDANQTEVATVTTAGESESDSEDDSNSDTDSDSDDDELDDDIAAVTGDTPGTFDDKAPEPEPEEEVEEIPNAPHRPIRAQPARAAKQGVTYSALNVEQHPVHDDCDPRVVGKYIHAMNHSFIQTYSLKAGLRKFKDQGMAAALKEMKQQHKQACFVPINYDDLTKTEHGKMMEMVSHMLEKRDKTVKFCNCANGSVQRN